MPNLNSQRARVNRYHSVRLMDIANNLLTPTTKVEASVVGRRHDPNRPWIGVMPEDRQRLGTWSIGKELPARYLAGSAPIAVTLH